MTEIFNIILVVTGILLTIAVLLQPKEAGLGVALTGGQDTVTVERRGPAKTLHTLTVILAVIFVGTALIHFLVS